MSQSYDSGASSRSLLNKKHVAYVAGGLAVLGVCAAVRWHFGPLAADAQAPRAAANAPLALPANTGANAPVAGTRPSANGGGAAATAPMPPSAKAELKVMARVNSDEISRQELANECLRRFGNDVIESMMNKHLILYACKTRNIVVTQQDVEREITTMASKFGLSNDRWLEMLQKERGIAPDQYRNDIVWPTLALRKLAADSIQVSPAEVQQGLEAQFGAKVQARIISTATAKKAEELRAKAVANPEAFGDLAKEFSEDPNSAAARGLIPPISRYTGDATVEQAAFALKEGEVSPVIHAANQYLVLKCDKLLPATPIPAEERKRAEDKVALNLRDKKLRSASTVIFKKLQDEAKVENIYNNPEKQKQMPGVAALVNGQTVTVRDLAEECLSRHGAEVLEGEINRHLLQQALKARGQTVAESEIDAEIARAAKNYGFVKNGKVDLEGWLKRITEEQNVSVDLYVRDAVWPTVALKKLVGDSVAVSDEDLKKGFEANYGERVEAQVCVLSNQRQAQQVWEDARRSNTEEFFGQLAQQYSIEPVSKANSGRVPPIRKFGGQPAIEKEAFTLKKGELSGIVVVGDKFIIMRCLGRTKPVVVDFAEVKDQLKDDIHEKQMRLAMANTFDNLRDSAAIDNYLAGTSQTPKRTKTAEGGRTAPADAASPAPGATGQSAVAPRATVGSGQPIPTYAPRNSGGVAPAGATMPATGTPRATSGSVPAPAPYGSGAAQRPASLPLR